MIYIYIIIYIYIMYISFYESSCNFGQRYLHALVLMVSIITSEN